MTEVSGGLAQDTVSTHSQAGEGKVEQEGGSEGGRKKRSQQEAKQIGGNGARRRPLAGSPSLSHTPAP
ncbi:hypothetical protein GN956_G11741 [Arapaima gigas]